MTARRTRACLILLAALSMAHVGSPDTFFTGKAGPYDVRVSVRLPGVIPGRAQVAVRVIGSIDALRQRVSVQAGQWNVGLQGAPPPEVAAPVPGDSELYAAELWFMTASSYQLAVRVEGASGPGTVMLPVLALATAERPMPPWLGGVLAALGVLLTAGFLTMIGAAVRESVLPPGLEPDAPRRRRARIGMAVSAAGAALVLWGGNAWWAAEANGYRAFVLYRPFSAIAHVAPRGGLPTLTLSIRDSRWTGTPTPASRYNALLPDHGKLMHLFLVRESDLDAFAHGHPVARSREALDFDAVLPPLPAGRYRVYADIVHESGYAQTIESTVDLPEVDSGSSGDPDDSAFRGDAVAEAPLAVFDLGDGARVIWDHGAQPFLEGEEQLLQFAVEDASESILSVEPYMGMAAHVIVASHDHSVFAHLHPSGSISMAALEKFSGIPATALHARHLTLIDSRVGIPFAFPKAGAYRVWVQVKRDGQVRTAAFDVDVRETKATSS